MSEEVKTKETKKEEKPQMREIVIETDGNDINIKKAEVSGKIELSAILERILRHLNTNEK